MNSPNISSLFKSQKTVGLRAFFPDLPSHMSTYEKAKIWVKRHNNNYYIGWSEEQLQTLDPIVRPLTIITAQLYKRHMNRSEYGRITKLKFCLESDADWAKEFRIKLMDRAHDGGFKSLGEAKIAATELWRRHSELYDVQRARIAGSHKSTDRSRPIPSSDNTPPKRLCSSGPHDTVSPLSDINTENSEGETSGSLIDSLSYAEASDNYPSVLASDTIGDTDEQNTHDIMKVDNSSPPKTSCKSSNEVQSCCVFDTSFEATEKKSLFQDVFSLPLTVQEKMEVLLQRQKHNFFKDWTNDQLTLLNESVRPSWLVTEDTYRDYLASDEGQFTTCLCNILNSDDEKSTMFREKLYAFVEDENCSSWRDIERHAKNIRNKEKISFEVLMGRMDASPFEPDISIHSTPIQSHLSLPEQSRSSGPSCQGKTEVKKNKSAFRSSWPLTPLDSHPSSKVKSDIVRQRKLYRHTTPETMVGSDSRESSILKTETKTTATKRLTDNFLTRMSSDMIGGTQPQECSTSILPNLWSLRNLLIEQCTEDPGTSWHDKLRPHLLLIRAQLGETYTLPSTVAECIADLTLVTLHKAFSSAACSPQDCLD